MRPTRFATPPGSITNFLSVSRRRRSRVDRRVPISQEPRAQLQYYTWRLTFSRIRLYKMESVSNFPMAGLDSTDCRILQSLQIDASQSLAISGRIPN
jgi:hypothetical protein